LLLTTIPEQYMPVDGLFGIARRFYADFFQQALEQVEILRGFVGGRMFSWIVLVCEPALLPVHF
jgi:hypothetical protein